MAPRHLSYLSNPVSSWYWEHGGEEIIGPLGPYAAGISRAVARVEPEPAPWRVAVGQLVQAVQAKDLAAKLPKGLQEQTVKSSTAAIADVLDDWCGTPPRKWPWPWPGPPPWIWDIVSELSAVANSLPAGSLRDGIIGVAAQVVQKAAAENR
jgi:hypothetical protein